MISVLTPTFNHAKFLGDALSSVLRQDTKSELIVVDGGSTDGTVDLLKSYGSSLTWTSEADSGQSEALNKALAQTTGDAVGWLNADEYYMPGVLSHVTDLFRSRPGLGMVMGDAVLVNSDGSARRLYATHRVSAPALKWYDCYILTSSLFIRKDLLANFSFDEDLRVCMDWDLLLHLLGLDFRTQWVPNVFSGFRVYPEQASTRLRELRANEVERLRERHSVQRGNAWARRRFGRLHRTALKSLDGAYAREVRYWIKQRGTDTRWMATVDCHEITAPGQDEEWS